MTTDPLIIELASAARRRRRLPAGAACSSCSSTTQLLLLPDGEVRCYSHRKKSAGAVELDHWAGRSTLPRTVIPLDGNAHRRVTEIRRLVGLEDFPPAEGDPVLTLAHLLGGVASLLVLFAAWLVEYAAFVSGQVGGTPPAFPVQP